MFDRGESFDLIALLEPAVLAGFRIGGVMLVAPFFGSPALPAPVKAALTLALTAVLYPAYHASAARSAGATAGTGGGALWVEVATEITIGIGLGLTMQFLFDAAQLAGQILGVQTGLSVATILDPQSQADSPALSVFNQIIVIMIFLSLNVHHWLLRVLADSFTYLPAGGVHLSQNWSAGLLQAASGIWTLGVQLAVPVIAATLVADVAMGFLARAAPQLPVLFLGVSVKNILGLSVLAGTLALWPSLWERHFRESLMWAERLLHLAA